jgi:hypothetical protein
MQVPVVERLALYFNELVVNSQDVCPDTEIHKVRGFSPDPQGAMNESSLLSVLREAVFSGTPSMKTIAESLSPPKLEPLATIFCPRVSMRYVDDATDAEVDAEDS